MGRGRWDGKGRQSMVTSTYTSTCMSCACLPCPAHLPRTSGSGGRSYAAYTLELEHGSNLGGSLISQTAMLELLYELELWLAAFFPKSCSACGLSSAFESQFHLILGSLTMSPHDSSLSFPPIVNHGSLRPQQPRKHHQL
jgi:hypothetical protein